MENFKILNIGKSLFWLSFILGNIALFGYIISGNGVFQIIGFMLLTYGTVINLIAFAGLLLFGIFAPKHTTDAIKSALILLINIPIAILYFYIGISI